MNTFQLSGWATGVACTLVKGALVASVAYVLQVLPGKLDAWKEFHSQLDGLRRWDFEDQQRRLGLVRHRVWLQESSDGPMALVVQEGEDPERALTILAASSHPFDVWFREQVMDVHGIDLSQPLTIEVTLFVDYLHQEGHRGPEYDLPDFNA